MTSPIWLVSASAEAPLVPPWERLCYGRPAMSTGRRPSVVIAAGGTGGHIFPGLAVAEALVRARPDVRVVFVGTSRGLEGRLIPEAGHRLELVDMVPFAGKERLRIPVALPRSIWQCTRVLRRNRPTWPSAWAATPASPS